MTRRRVGAWFATLVVACACLVVPITTAAPAAAAGDRAVVVVDTGNGVMTRVIEFSGSVSGIGALELAGASPQMVDYGGGLGKAVCKLFGAGDEAANCPGGWSYYRSTGGASSWGFSSLGVSNTAVHDGDVEGWKYGGGRPNASARFCDYVACAPAATDPPPVVTQTPSAPAGGGSVAPGAAGGSVAAGGAGASTTNGATGLGGTDADGTPSSNGEASTSATTSTTRGSASRRDTEEAALASSQGATGTSGGSGSPIGLAVVGVLLAIAATVAVVVRRRGRRTPRAPSA